MGLIFLARSLAAVSPNAKVAEAETYASSSNLTTISDASASNSSYVQFVTAGSGSGAGCDLNATTANFASQLTAATTGQTICLSTGNYGTFSGTNKAVTIKAASGANPVMNLDFGNGDTGFTLDGMTGMSGDIVGSASNITIKNSIFTSSIHVGTTVANANIILDGNTHMNISPGQYDYAGRIHLDATGVPCGITVRNSTISGGYSDGIRADCNGILIEGNKFIDIQDAEPYHADPIQVYGGRNVIIRRNLFDNRGTTGLPNASVAAYVMLTDGQSITLEDNVFRSPGYTFLIEMGVDSGSSIIQNNTAEAGTCSYGQACGQYSIAGGSPTVRNNIVGRVPTSGSVYNMAYGGSVSGSNFLGTPIFVGGATRTNYEDFYLATGSPGKNAGSDGKDVGIR